MLSHGDSSGIAEDPAQIAMARLSRWATTIEDGSTRIGVVWLRRGVEILTTECELVVLGECEAQLRPSIYVTCFLRTADVLQSTLSVC